MERKKPSPKDYQEPIPPHKYSQIQKEVRDVFDFILKDFNTDFDSVFVNKSRQQDFAGIRIISSGFVYNMFSTNRKTYISQMDFGAIIGKDHATVKYHKSQYDGTTKQNNEQRFAMKEAIISLMENYDVLKGKQFIEYKSMTINITNSKILFIKEEDGTPIKNVFFNKLEEAKLFIDGYICGQTKLNSPTPTKHVL